MLYLFTHMYVYIIDSTHMYIHICLQNLLLFRVIKLRNIKKKKIILQNFYF